MSNLKELTVSEYLLNLRRPKKQSGVKLPFARYEIVPEDSRVPDSEGRQQVLGVAANPLHSTKILPQFIFRSSSPGVGAAPDRVQAETSVGGDRAALNVSGERSISGGPYDMNYINARVGPLSFFGSEGTGEGREKIRRVGGSASLGPVALYGEREDTTRTVIPERDRRFFTNPNVDVNQRVFGVRGSVPVGPGTLFADLSRRLSGVREPQFFLQPQRPQHRGPNVTELRGEYAGKVGPGRLGLAGRYTDIRGRGTDKEAGLSYMVDDPLGRGGQFTAQGTYANPYGAPSAAQGTLRYTLPLGGRR